VENINYRMIVLKSDSTNPTVNFEEERRLFYSPERKEYLFFYINRPTVVVGSNQHIEAEADTEYCHRNGIEIVRRISGGGAVYHDDGNINFAFIVNKNGRSPLDVNLIEPIIDVLQSLGIDAVAGPRKEIFLKGKKISGTATYVSADRILFHGTLLYNTDLTHLHLALRGNPALRGRKVASVPAEVGNISEICGLVCSSAADFLSIMMGEFSMKERF